MASSEAPSKVKVVIENVERISVEFQQLEESSIEFRDDIQKAILGNDKSLEMQKVINVISYLDKSLAYLNLIKYVEKIR